MRAVGKQRPAVALLVAILCWALAAGAFAASTGQIKGRLIDKDTKEPVVGASILIKGTKIGNLTDFDGNYIITRVDPGTYTLVISSVEYKNVEVTGVKVNSDLTTEQNFSMEKKVSELDKEIVVTATMDIIDKYDASSTQKISAEVIKTKPVTTVDAILQQVAGVQTSATGQVFIRGGRAGEVSYIVDGVPINDPLGGLGQTGANLSLTSGSIQEIQIIKDGFDPEYGNALSGIVKVTTQTGNKDNTRFNAQFLTDDLGSRSLNKYSRNFDYARMSLSGPDLLLREKVLPALGLKFLQDKEFTYYLFGDVEKHDGIFQYYDYDTPLNRRTEDAFNMFGINVPERRYNRYYWMANLKFRPRQDMNVIMSYKQSSIRAAAFDWDYRYSSRTAPVYEDKWRSLSIEVSQSLFKNTTYEALFSYYDKEFNQKPGDPQHPGQGLNPDQFRFDYEWENYTDRNRNGVYDAPEPIINLYPDSANYGTDFTGPGYTFGEYIGLTNVQGGGVQVTDFRFNDNGILDNLEGEPFLDVNGNGVWDQGDYLQDKNGNGRLDADRISPINNRDSEPFVDGDSILGEPFSDVNRNGVYDPTVDIFIISGDSLTNQDLNYNGVHDGPDEPWTEFMPFIDRNGNDIYDFPNGVYDVGEPYTDVNGNGRYDQGGSATFLNQNSHQTDAAWHRRNTETYRGELKVFQQLGAHELKGGVAITRESFSYEDIRRPYTAYSGRADSVNGQPAPYDDRGAFRDFFSYEPWNGTIYLRDKIEYGSMIASLGLRWDFFLQDTKKLQPVAKKDALGSGLIIGDRHKWSPRIGFSYPISDKAKVYFNYGHFYQLGEYRYMYARNTASVDQNDVVGNYNLDYQKTIQYSFGVKYAVTENYSVDFQGYFKDEFDKINSAEIRESGITRQQYRNRDYGRSRGVEVTIEKLGGGYVNGQLSYTYAFAFGKASQTTENYLSDFLLSRDPLSEAALDNDIRHSLKVGVQFYIPNTVKPRLFGLPIANGWSLSIESVIESGRPFTPDGRYPNLTTGLGEDPERNSLRYPATAVFDVRFSKEFSLVGIDYSLIFWVENLFDSRNVVSVSSLTGRADTSQPPVDRGLVPVGTEYDRDPSNWDYGRQIRLGLEMNL